MSKHYETKLGAPLFIEGFSISLYLFKFDINYIIFNPFILKKNPFISLKKKQSRKLVKTSTTLLNLFFI